MAEYVGPNIFIGALRAGDMAAFYERAEQLRLDLLAQSSPLIKDRSYHLKTYKKCFKGDRLVSFLVEKKMCRSRTEAQAVGAVLLMFRVIHHVVDDHHFKDEPLFYRFLCDENPSAYQGTEPTFQALARKALHIYSMMHLNDNLIFDRGYGLKTYTSCFLAQVFIEWSVEQGLASDADDAIKLGNDLRQAHFIHHVCDDHEFKDDYLFFRWYLDELSYASGFKDFCHSQDGVSYLGLIKGGKRLSLRRRPLPALPTDGQADSDSASEDLADRDGAGAVFTATT